MRRVFLLLGFVTACSKPSGPVPVAPDPVTVHDAAKPDAPPAKGKKHAVLHGRVIDLEARAVAHELRKTLPKFEASDDKRAYLVDGDVVAYDLSTGTEQWKASPSTCAHPTLGDADVWCADGTKAIGISKADGKMRVVASASPSPIAQLVDVGGRLVVRRADRTLESFDRTSGALLAATPVASVDHHGLVPTAGRSGFCAVGADGKDFRLSCYGPDLVAWLLKTIVVKKPTDPAATWFHVRALTPRYVLLGSQWSSAPKRTVIVRLLDGVEVLRIDEEIATVVETAEGGVEGFLALEKGGFRFLDPSGKPLWSAKAPLADAASAVLHDNRIVVATFHQASSGAALDAWDRASGKKLWSADVELLPVAHSAYVNDVRVSIAAGAVLLRGDEAAFTYLQLFDPTDGKRLFSEIRMVW